MQTEAEEEGGLSTGSSGSLILCEALTPDSDHPGWAGKVQTGGTGSLGWMAVLGRLC